MIAGQETPACGVALDVEVPPLDAFIVGVAFAVLPEVPEEELVVGVGVEVAAAPPCPEVGVGVRVGVLVGVDVGTRVGVGVGVDVTAAPAPPVSCCWPPANVIVPVPSQESGAEAAGFDSGAVGATGRVFKL